MRVEFGFGVGFDRNNEPLTHEFVRLATKQILVEACTAFGGCNMVAGQGAWTDENGTLVLEESRILVVDIVAPGRIGGEYDASDDAKIRKLAEYIRSSLNQAAVHVTKLVATSRDVYIHKG